MQKSLVGILTMFACLSEAASLRNANYCEVVVGHGLKADVYVSKLNGCSQQLWKKLDVRKLKQEKHATFVYLNGPRYILVDDMNYPKLQNSKHAENFGGIKMYKAAQVRVTFMDIVKGFRPYKEHTIYRNSTWNFSAGQPVYELISPKGKVYVMQSYSGELAQQDANSLSKLSSKLALPAGWRFKTGTLRADKRLVGAKNKAVITQDRFKNTYQLASRDLLAD